MPGLEHHLEQLDFAYLTTAGRVSGNPHRIEIWFTILDGDLWVNSGGRFASDWVKNLEANPEVVLEIGSSCWTGTATTAEEHGPMHLARQRLAARYQGWKTGEQLSSWAIDGLLVKIEVNDDR